MQVADAPKTKDLDSPDHRCKPLVTTSAPSVAHERVGLLPSLLRRKKELLLWLLIAIGFSLLQSVAIYLLSGWFGQSLTWVVFLVSAEVVLLLRFAVYDLYVFKNSRLSLRRAIDYHFANAASFAVHQIASNLLALSLAPMLIALFLTQSSHEWSNALAGLMATALSLSLSLYTNFFWVWKRNDKTRI